MLLHTGFGKEGIWAEPCARARGGGGATTHMPNDNKCHRAAGILSFWRGNGAAVVRVVPYMSITFLGFEEYKILLKRALPKYVEAAPSLLTFLRESVVLCTHWGSRHQYG